MTKPKQVSQETLEGLKMFRQLLQGRQLGKDSPVLEKVLLFLNRPGLGDLPDYEKSSLATEVKRCFDLTEDELLGLLSGVSSETFVETPLQEGPVADRDAARLEEELWNLIPKGSYIEQYCRYTQHSEAPLAYHIFCSLVAVGLLIGRRVWFNMGYYKLYPPLAVFLLGPSGVKKTSASNIMLNMVKEIEQTIVYPERPTPEVLAEVVQKHPQGLLFAPEMTSMLGKAKYLEGLITLITRLQDCPDICIHQTIGRGETIIKDVAMSVLMCSTPDWFASNTPESTFGGGFVARNIMVMQNASPREEDIPSMASAHLRDDLVARLAELRNMQHGEMKMTAACRKFHKEWYHQHKLETQAPEHPLLATFYQRKPDHVKKLAMCMEMIENYSLEMRESTLINAIALANWIEQFVPPLLRSMFKSQVGEQAEFVLRQIKAAGGVIPHSSLVRKCQHKFNAQTLRGVIGSLREADMVVEIANNIQHTYILKEG